MKWLETDPIPVQCLGCEEDCYNCDYAGERWFLSREDELRLKRKGLEKARERIEKQIYEIDEQLALYDGEELHF